MRAPIRVWSRERSQAWVECEGRSSAPRRALGVLEFGGLDFVAVWMGDPPAVRYSSREAAMGWRAWREREGGCTGALRLRRRLRVAEPVRVRRDPFREWSREALLARVRGRVRMGEGYFAACRALRLSGATRRGFERDDWRWAALRP